MSISSFNFNTNVANEQTPKLFIQSLNGAEGVCPWELSNVVFDCTNLLALVPVWSASFTPRLSNCLAHNIAQWACFSSSFGSLDFTSVPEALLIGYELLVPYFPHLRA
ncbi:hypothetical protein TorRG33x02_114580 [Trema orientale]|uniref:RNase H type-1 domain-containing protein n=1 Tax=Trema orientale TaxID=63057 RepID=A0A2P5F4Z6_TREOI|nr:hypothetical protein TorRG33x02_114580 [Trema orientale]